MGMVRMIQSVLEKEGYSAIGLSDPSRIEQMIDSEGPNLILLDVVMPDRNGFQVCRTLKHSQAYKSIPIIVVSGKSTPGDRFWAEKHAPNGYIVKPFAPADLFRAVRTFA